MDIMTEWRWECEEQKLATPEKELHSHDPSPEGSTENRSRTGRPSAATREAAVFSQNVARPSRWLPHLLKYRPSYLGEGGS